MIPVFLHGLESSSKGTKGRWFSERFPDMLMPDFTGSLDERMIQLRHLLYGKNDLVLVGSSFGGLMATVYAIECCADVSKVVLLAPALNFHDFEQYSSQSTDVRALLYTGDNDTVCPPEIIIPAAERAFTDLTVY